MRALSELSAAILLQVTVRTCLSGRESGVQANEDQGQTRPKTIDKLVFWVIWVVLRALFCILAFLLRHGLMPLVSCTLSGRRGSRSGHWR